MEYWKDKNYQFSKKVNTKILFNASRSFKLPSRHWPLGCHLDISEIFLDIFCFPIWQLLE